MVFLRPLPTMIALVGPDKCITAVTYAYHCNAPVFNFASSGSTLTAHRGAGYRAACMTILVDNHCHFEAVSKKEKQRKFPFAAFQACTLPQVLRQLVRKISMNTLPLARSMPTCPLHFAGFCPQHPSKKITDLASLGGSVPDASDFEGGDLVLRMTNSVCQFVS
jgi:hypothetical protein